MIKKKKTIFIGGECVQPLQIGLAKIHYDNAKNRIINNFQLFTFISFIRKPLKHILYLACQHGPHRDRDPFASSC